MQSYKVHRHLYRTPRWRRLRKLIFDRDGWKCVRCGKHGRMEADHKQPITKGGDFWNPGNIQTLCSNCHRSKTAIDHYGPPDPKRTAWQDFVKELT